MSGMLKVARGRSIETLTTVLVTLRCIALGQITLILGYRVLVRLDLVAVEVLEGCGYDLQEV